MEIWKIMDMCNLRLYERNRKGENCPKYVVFHRIRKVFLKEFRRKSSAIKFIRENCFTR